MFELFDILPAPCYNRFAVTGTAPIIKNGFLHDNSNTAKGATPIEKNVFVVDELGNQYEATYPKRAKGLVKNGRARFISENTICLACPPKLNLEDKHMTDHIKTPDTNVEIPKTNVKPDEKPTLRYVLEQIEKIAVQTEYLNQAIAQLGNILDGISGEPGSPGDLAGQEKAKALGDIVRCRETTNQQLLSFYAMLYTDLKHQSGSVSDSVKTI
ncbi:MAG TPA: hypothetical protein PK629_02935 [Oscillospiraceae bacterium]|nr:hypothetical protein [Oscillospiraceae bacterium]HPF56631.1 hypothetical protein [Clostridiales bacterium]HPK34281.1 hypothetical protein [Oscillospiraceae bacterium]HPR74816.1 hypothetical protein [Oscillospiraceae bacterium]